MFKDESEVAIMRNGSRHRPTRPASDLAGDQAGRHEREIAAELMLQLLRAGGDPEAAFSPIVSGGPNSANPHASPSDRPLQNGDLLVIDWGASYQGYISDLTRTFAIGQVEPEFVQIARIVAEANAAGRAAAGPGVAAGLVDKAARDVIEKAGYGAYFFTRTGHGIGMEVHEEPYIRAGNPLHPATGDGFYHRAWHLPDRTQRRARRRQRGDHPHRDRLPERFAARAARSRMIGKALALSYPRLIPTAEPFFFPGGPVGCLLVHGFTGTPKEMRWLGEYLAEQGHTVSGRAPLRACHPARRYDPLTLVGLGGQRRGRLVDALSVHKTDLCHRAFDGRHPGFVERLLPASGRGGRDGHPTPSAPRPAPPFHKAAQPFLALSCAKGPPDWYDLEAYREHVSYPADPTRAYAELRDLLVEMRAGLPRVSAPALLIYSKNDPTVKASDGHMEKIYDSLGSRIKQTLWVENSGHVITRDAARQTVFQAVAEFVSEISEETCVSRDLILIALSLMTWGLGEGMFYFFQPLYLQELGADPLKIGTILGLVGLAMMLSYLPGRLSLRSHRAGAR